MKNFHTLKNSGQDGRNLQNENKDPKTTDEQSTGLNSNPYDSENLDQELDSSSKDITEKDIERDLVENDPSKGFETDIDKTQSIDEQQSDAFETTRSDKENPVNKEFEIGQLGSEELQQDERTRDQTDNDAVHFNKPSERKF